MKGDDPTHGGLVREPSPDQLEPAFYVLEWVLLAAVGIATAFVALVFGVPPAIALLIPATFAAGLWLWQVGRRGA